MFSINELRRRQASMEAARRMGSQAGLPPPRAELLALEDRVVAGEITIDEAVAHIVRSFEAHRES